MNPDGTMARVRSWSNLPNSTGFKMITVAALIQYRRKNENWSDVWRRPSCLLNTGISRQSLTNRFWMEKKHIALVKGDITESDNVTGQGPFGVPDRGRIWFTAL
jgi:3,4-dihydroxy 2-butanone 4-phosphate synthase/GTP cyclohydrolase II